MQVAESEFPAQRSPVSTVPTVSVSSVDPVDTGWRTAPCAAVVTDAEGVVRAVNDAGAGLFPAARIGEPLAATAPWLAEAHLSRDGLSRDGDESVEGWVGDRCFQADPVRHPDRSTTWWLHDATTAHSAEQALRVERRRTALLSETSTALMASLNVERCMETAAQLAATHLADAALVLAPHTRSGLPAAACVRDGEPAQVVFPADPAELPGLSEALQGFPPVPSRWIDPASAPDWVLPDGFDRTRFDRGHPAARARRARRRARAAAAARHAPAFTDEEEVFARLFAAGAERRCPRRGCSPSSPRSPRR